MKSGEFIEKIGRRKKSSARVRVYEGKEKSTINGKSVDDYVNTAIGRNKLLKPFKICGVEGKYYYTALVRGGGITGQVGAIILGISRSLVEIDESNKALLKKEGFLTRDPRMVERKKYYLKKARKKPRFSKR